MSEVFTFIIPAYNAAPYLLACLDSVYALDLKGCTSQVIVVNDGSTDRTSVLLQKYTKRHKDLVVITQENQGLSVARNVGMDNARGRYLCFVDADDVLLPADLTPVLDAMRQGIDIIGVNLQKRRLNGKIYPYRRYIPPYNDVFRPAREFMLDRNLMPCVCSNLYRREFIEAQKLRFLPGIYHEDEDFTPRAFALAASYVAVDVCLYEYVTHAESITTTTNVEKRKKRLRDMVLVLSRLDAFARQDAERLECMRCKLSYLAVDVLRILIRHRHPSIFRKEILSELRSLGYFPLPWRWNLKYIAFNLLTRFRYL